MVLVYTLSKQYPIIRLCTLLESRGGGRGIERDRAIETCTLAQSPPPPPPTRGIGIVVVVLLLLIVTVALGLKNSPWWFIPSFLLLAALMYILIRIAYTCKQSGFGELIKITEKIDPTSLPTIPLTSLPKAVIEHTEEYIPAKTLWDWSGLLIIPIFLLIATLAFGFVQNGISLQAVTTQHANDQTAVVDQQQETLLNSYFDSMSALLLTNNAEVRAQDPTGADIRSMARARTLTVLRRLDGARKGYVLKFLHDAGLINRDPFPIVNLADADFSNAQLCQTNLCKVNLGGANLAATNLSGAYLINTNLNAADLAEANLNGTHLNGATLAYAQIIAGADLRGADLTNADLSGANLTGTKMQGAILKKTDISGTAPGCDLLGTCTWC